MIQAHHSLASVKNKNTLEAVPPGSSETATVLMLNILRKCGMGATPMGPAC